MAEFESIRQIARRLVAEFRAKKAVHKMQPFPGVQALPSLTQETSVAVADPIFDGMDREWLRELGIEA